MDNFKKILQKVMDHGVLQKNRTGIDSLMIPGEIMKFDLSEGFPLMTGKKMPVKGMTGELLSFFRGYTSAEDFRRMGCLFWDQNANENKDWLNNPHRKGHDDLGRVYGKQWTDWKKWEEVHDHDKARVMFEEQGYEIVAYDDYKQVFVLRKGINQLEETLKTLLTNPYDRRLVITGWRIDEFDRMALRPCHMDYEFIADVKNNVLHLCMFQFSCDLFLGVPVNIASASLFLELMARLSGFKAGTFTHFLGNAHIYENHFDQVNELIGREDPPLPTIEISENVRKVSLDEVKGAFERIEPEDVLFKNYRPLEAIKASMAV